MSTHTDTPWEYAPQARAIVGKPATRYGTRPTICTMPGNPGKAHETEKADIRLICAAPKLLKALSDLLFFCEEFNPHETMREVWEAAQEAVDLARHADLDEQFHMSGGL